MAARALGESYDCVSTARLEDLEAGSVPAEAVLDRTILLPYALELGEAARSALESVADRLRQSHPACDFRLAPHIGFDRRLVDILEDRVGSAARESSLEGNVPIMTVERQGATRRFSLADLADLPGRIADIGAHVPGRSGEAVPVGDLLEAAGAAEADGTATFRSGDDFSADVPVATARQGWLVFRMDGAPLPARYGGPVRLFIPGSDDRCANVKSVDHIRIS